jgi:hypothetical protein
MLCDIVGRWQGDLFPFPSATKGTAIIKENNLTGKPYFTNNSNNYEYNTKNNNNGLKKHGFLVA